MEDLSRWPKVLPRIQSLLNNTSSSTTGKTPNEITYSFSPRRPLDLISALDMPNTCVTRTDAADAISFALLNQKEHYDRKHQPLFMKVGDWAMLRLHKDYSISSSAKVTKKLTQQYVGPFQIKERVGRLAYRLEIPNDWWIHPVFSVAQLEPAPEPSIDPFRRPYPHDLPAVFVDDDTNSLKSFEIDRLLNKRTIKRGKGLTVEYLVRWTGYGPGWDRWYNVKDLDNAAELVREYEEGLAQRGRWFLFFVRREIVMVWPLFAPIFFLT